MSILGTTKNKFKDLIRWFLTSRTSLVLLLAGVVVSIATSHMEDMVKRQRYLELLEYEIETHLAEAKNLPEQYNESTDFNKHYIPNKFYQSVLNSGYLISIEPQLFLEITTYYELVNLANQRLQRNYDYHDQIENDWVLCGYNATSSATLESCDEKKQILDKANNYIPEREKNIWNGTVKWIYDYEINKKFHPTQDRLDSPLLKLLMGNKALQDFKQ